MSSAEIAELLELRHDNVRQAASNLESHGIITFTESTVKGSGRPKQVMHFNERSSIVIAAKLNDKLMARIVDAFLEMRNSKQPFQIPQTLGEALQLAADQAKQLELQAPKVAFVDNCVERGALMTAGQVGQKHGMSAIKLNKFLDALGGVYNRSVKRSRVFSQSFIDSGLGELKQTEQGYSQALFTAKGEQWINEKLINEGVI